MKGKGATLSISQNLIGLKDGGVISGFEPLQLFQHGGLITRPTLGMMPIGKIEKNEIKR
jgi:hypothetical protein